MTKQNYTHAIGCRSRDSNKMFGMYLAGFARFNVVHSDDAITVEVT